MFWDRKNTAGNSQRRSKGRQRPKPNTGTSTVYLCCTFAPSIPFFTQSQLPPPLFLQYLLSSIYFLFISVHDLLHRNTCAHASCTSILCMSFSQFSIISFVSNNILLLHADTCTHTCTLASFRSMCFISAGGGSQQDQHSASTDVHYCPSSPLRSNSLHTFHLPVFSLLSAQIRRV